MEEQEFQQFINDVNQESENSIDINKNQIEKLKHKIRIQTSKIHNLSQKIRGILPNEVGIMEILYCYDLEHGMSQADNDNDD